VITFHLKIDGPELKRVIAKGARPIIGDIAFAIEARMKELMTGPKSGRAYKRGAGVHIASAPGEAPAVDTGFLINSIQTTIKSDTEAEIMISAEYAEALEFGSRKMAARPFVRPAIEGILQRFGRGGFLASARE
jgi:HK97 gp10 family phage protein